MQKTLAGTNTSSIVNSLKIQDIRENPSANLGSLDMLCHKEQCAKSESAPDNAENEVQRISLRARLVRNYLTISGVSVVLVNCMVMYLICTI